MIPNITTGADFGELLDYLVENRDHELLDLHGVSSVALAAEEMAAIAALSHRAKVKLIHLSLSAAHEDGKLSGDNWLKAVDRHERAFGLRGHQRVVVRHKDKTHDHVHVFWCTISLETGQTPPKRWFLRKGFAIDEVGPQALSEEQVKRVPAEHRARRTYDFILLRRAQHLCRQLERDFKLRELRSPQQAAEARLAGEERAPSVGQQKRAERTGAVPLIGRAQEIRTALDETDWPSKRRALSAIDLDLEPVFRTTKRGEELRGLIIFDQADPGNRMKASQLDTATRKYGWRKLEERHAPGMAGLETWWPRREVLPLAPPARRPDPAARLNRQFDLVLEQHRLFEREKQLKLKALRTRQSLAVKALRQALMFDRRKLALNFPPADRREFYKRFDKDDRRPALTAMMERHRREALIYRRAKQPGWNEFLQVSAKAGDLDAMRALANSESASRQVPERSLERRGRHVDEPLRFQVWRPTVVDQQPEVETESLPPEALLRAINAQRDRGL
jgi:hypothetical protein